MVVGVAAALSLLVTASPSSAGTTGGVVDNGSSIQVTVSGQHVNYDRVGSIPAPVPLCWWVPTDDIDDPHDAEKMKEWFEAYKDANRGTWVRAHFFYPSDDVFDAAVAADEQGDGVTWYKMKTRSDVGTDAVAMQELIDAGCTTSRANDNGYPLLETATWRPYGVTPPPRIEAEVLAQYAADVLDILEPTIQWNPRITDLNGATMVNLPTWAWVDRPGSLGERTATASIPGLSATVVASSGGLSISAPGGVMSPSYVSCTRQQALTVFSPGTDPSSACVFEFTRASHSSAGGTFSLEASADWGVEWTASNGESGTLDDRTLTASTQIRVAGSQALVTQVD